MRCLYCGKELALLKRLTGGEFCSDAHRQRYQEEYNQLALNRLLQAKPPGELKSPSTEAKAPESKTPEITKPKDDLRPLETKRAQETPGPGQQPIQERATPPVSPAPAAPPSPEPPGAKPEPEGIAPGFLVDLPVPVMAKVMPMPAPELDLLPSGEREFDAVQIEPVAAGKVRFQPLPRVVDCSTRPREKGVELREFPRTTPIVEVRLGPAGETGLETSARPMEIQFLPQPPPESPLWRQEAEKEF